MGRRQSLTSRRCESFPETGPGIPPGRAFQYENCSPVALGCPWITHLQCWAQQELPGRGSTRPWLRPSSTQRGSATSSSKGAQHCLWVPSLLFTARPGQACAHPRTCFQVRTALR